MEIAITIKMIIFIIYRVRMCLIPSAGFSGGDILHHTEGKLTPKKKGTE